MCIRDRSIPGGAGLGWIFNKGIGKYEKWLEYEGVRDAMFDVRSFSKIGLAYQSAGGSSRRFGLYEISDQLKEDIFNHFGQDTFPDCKQGLHQANIALGGPTGAHRQFIKERLVESDIARANLELAFGPIDFEKTSSDSLKLMVAMTLDAFQRVDGMKLPKVTKFAKVMRGEASFTIPEANGFALFKTHCVSCHENQVFGSNSPKASFMSDNGGPNPNHLAQITGEVPDTVHFYSCLLYTSPSPRDRTRSRMPSSA